MLISGLFPNYRCRKYNFFYKPTPSLPSQKQEKSPFLIAIKCIIRILVSRLSQLLVQAAAMLKYNYFYKIQIAFRPPAHAPIREMLIETTTKLKYAVGQRPAFAGRHARRRRPKQQAELAASGGWLAAPRLYVWLLPLMVDCFCLSWTVSAIGGRKRVLPPQRSSCISRARNICTLSALITYFLRTRQFFKLSPSLGSCLHHSCSEGY
jgi:hypothetical protein